jgi:hypothetical protein
MATIRNNTLRPYTIGYKAGNGVKQIQLLPGVTLNVPDEDVDLLKQHTLFLSYLESGKFDIVSAPSCAPKHLEGVPVVDVRDEPNPVVETPKIEKVAKPRVSKA